MNHRHGPCTGHHYESFGNRVSMFSFSSSHSWPGSRCYQAGQVVSSHSVLRWFDSAWQPSFCLSPRGRNETLKPQAHQRLFDCPKVHGLRSSLWGPSGGKQVEGLATLLLSKKLRQESGIMFENVIQQ